MGNYIQSEESIYAKFGNDYRGIISTIGNKYIGDNPPAPFIFRSFNETGILCDGEGRYVFDCGKLFPGAGEGSYCYALGFLNSSLDRDSSFVIRCFSPSFVYVNNELVFASSGDLENFSDRTVSFAVHLKGGKNAFLLKFQKTTTGFGCSMGNAMPQWEPTHFLSPFIERIGESGFAFSEPVPNDIYSSTFPDGCCHENETGCQWFPNSKWTDKEQMLPVIQRIFSAQESPNKGVVCAWGKYECLSLETEIRIKCEVFSNVEIFVDGERIAASESDIDLTISRTFGTHDIFIKTEYISGRQWGFTLELSIDSKPITLLPPMPIKGYETGLIYLGILPIDNRYTINELRSTNVIYQSGGNEDDKIYWKLDTKDCVPRPFAENNLFGRWTYPLGVTLNGLLKAGAVLKKWDMLKYVKVHVESVTAMHTYALYDKEKYGYAGVNTQLTWLDALDDCGSFGSLMLECNRVYHNEDAVWIADKIAYFIKHVQKRLDDGAFFRGNQTMWADDLYMSVPFLCRYYELTKDECFLEDACNQILCYKKYMFMEDEMIMSHIYSLTHNKPTNVPWGRGNGWVLFSITELLYYLPREHKSYEDIIRFYNILVKGYIQLQGRNGLWHQVLNDSDSYEEASCTAMFICAFARGITNKYMDEQLISDGITSLYKAWDGLAKEAIDYRGNIYGICRGSGYSFSPDYYKSLSWNFNDTHGIGIIMLACSELLHLTQNEM